MSKKNILFLNGIADDKKISVTSIDKNNQIHYLLNGNANISQIMDKEIITPFDITFDLDTKQELNPTPNIHAIFNQISDADTHKITLLKSLSLYNTVSGKLPFFNAPTDILKTTRENIYKLLQGIDKLHVPKTVRIQPLSPSDIYEAIEKEDFEFPVIFRQAGDHSGISTIKIDDKSELFHTFALDGRDYYLTQFVDYADKDGIYAKYRLIVVDGEVFIRHAILSKEWMVHARNQLREKEKQSLTQPIVDNFLTKIKPLIQPSVTEIHHRLGLDYFGIDCHIDDNMNLLIFEVNPNMNVFVQLEDSIFKDLAEMARQALIKMIISEKY